VPVGPPTPLPSVNADASPRFILHVPIFEYHRVKPLTGEAGYVAGLVTVPEIFDAQMKAMALAGWHTITMGELGDYLRQSIQPAPKAFVVTFDDGYEDGYTWAYPILRRYGFVGTYFVVGSQIDKPEHMSIAEMQALLAAGCEIGNHTISHVDLRAKTPEQLTSEIYANSALIARDVGVWPQSFAYPIGLTNANVLAVLATTPGLETAVIQEGRGRETWANRWQLPRMRVGSGTYPQDLVDKATEYLQ
jgi:peptidoglycan/xylan/chitin deacetylase (PgdA/CDA1 family)